MSRSTLRWLPAVDGRLVEMVPQDVDLRAMTARVQGLVQAWNWLQDFPPISMDE